MEELTVKADGSIADHSDKSVSGNLAFLISQAGSKEILVCIPGKQVYAINSSLLIPSNMHLRVASGAVLQVSKGQTLTINGSFSAEPNQVFSGEGNVVFGGDTESGWAEWFGAVGDWDGSTGMDNTLVLRKFFASGLGHFKFAKPGGRYRINLPRAADVNNPPPYVYLARCSHKNGFIIEGTNCTIEDPQIYPNPSYSIVFGFDHCSNVKINGVGYIGHFQAAADMSRSGAIFVHIINGGENFDITASISGARYGIYAGEYNNYVKGNSRNFTIKLNAVNVGYPLALWYSGHNITGTIVADTTARAAYVAGVDGGHLKVYTKNHYLPIAVELAQARSGESSAQGASNMDIEAVDTGTTKPSMHGPSYLVGITPQFLPDKTTCWPHEYLNIKCRFNVVSTNTIAQHVGAFMINPSYTGSEVGNISFRNIQLSGVLDSSSQTIDSTKRPFWINGDSMNFYNVVVKDLTLLKGLGAVYDAMILMKGLQDTALLDNVHSTYDLIIKTNQTSKCNVLNSSLRRSSSPLAKGIIGNITFVNSRIE